MSAHALFETADEKQAARFARLEKLLPQLTVLYENFTAPSKVLNPEPDKEYVWARRDANAIASRRTWGFEIVRDKKADKPTAGEEWRQQDGSYVRGDTILMSIDKERYEALKLIPELKAIENLRQVKNPLLHKARQAGIRAHLESEDGATATGD